MNFGEFQTNTYYKFRVMNCSISKLQCFFTNCCNRVTAQLEYLNLKSCPLPPMTTLCTQLRFVCYTAIQAKNSMKSISAIYPPIAENMENDILVKRAPHISIRESHTVSISAMSNLFHNIVSQAFSEDIFGLDYAYQSVRK